MPSSVLAGPKPWVVLLSYQDCNLVLRAIVKTVNNVLHPKIMRPHGVAPGAVLQHDALSDAGYELRLVVCAISNLVYYPKKFHAHSLAASLVGS